MSGREYVRVREEVSYGDSFAKKINITIYYALDII